MVAAAVLSETDDFRVSVDVFAVRLMSVAVHHTGGLGAVDRFAEQNAADPPRQRPQKPTSAGTSATTATTHDFRRPPQPATAQHGRSRPPMPIHAPNPIPPSANFAFAALAGCASEMPLARSCAS